MGINMTEAFAIWRVWQPILFGKMLSFQTFRFTLNHSNLKGWGGPSMFSMKLY